MKPEFCTVSGVCVQSFHQTMCSVVSSEAFKNSCCYVWLWILFSLAFYLYLAFLTSWFCFCGVFCWRHVLFALVLVVCCVLCFRTVLLCGCCLRCLILLAAFVVCRFERCVARVGRWEFEMQRQIVVIGYESLYSWLIYLVQVCCCCRPSSICGERFQETQTKT